jgi:hypothetical protein
LFLVKFTKATADKGVSFVLPKVAAAFERNAWSKHGLKEGWFKITPETLAKNALVSGKPDSTDRSLLLIHGTFSNAASSFGPLRTSDFFHRAALLYGERIYAFNHFTVSRAPEENARMLLEELPDETFSFDVITHSRGGLVLRNLVERSVVFGPLARRFKLGKAVLVASPNDGTPLATPARWQDTVGWFANLLELFPENPFATGAEFVANALVWLARHASGDLPGLHSMDAIGDSICDLQGSPGPPPDAYSALVANYNPSGNILSRMLDTGIDQFFGTANDLVVPSESGWRIGHSPATFIPATRIGCYGPGGNLAPDSVTHVNFFSHQETVDFLVTALAGQAQQLPALDPKIILPDRRLVRSSRTANGTTTIGIPVSLPTKVPPVAPRKSATGATEQVQSPDRSTDETFYLTLLNPDKASGSATLIASFRNATVSLVVRLSDGEEGKRFHEIISLNRNIRSYVNGDEAQEPPHGEKLIEVGKQIFRSLFPGEVQRLYDVARATQRTGRINVIFTSAVGWVADLPYEFVYDPVRNTFLATSEINFTRNVITAVPADGSKEREEPLRILVIVAQPLGLAHLSAKQETEAIQSGYKRLIEANLASVDVLLDATPVRTHQVLELSPSFDIVHFIGHGEYDDARDTAFLIFQDETGRVQRIDSRLAQQIFCRRGIRLLFLNACETSKGGKADFNRGMAQSLVEGGIPTVVANQYSVLDVSATSFAQHFYWSLAHGNTIGDAAREARISVNYSIPGENLDWAVPVVFARNPVDRLALQHPTVDLASEASRTARGEMRRGRDYIERWALWDVQGMIPNLAAIARTLTDSQQRIFFDVVRLSAPLGTWRREHTKAGEKAYLNAAKVAQRLEETPHELGVKRLIAITNLPLRDEEDLNLYTWNEDPNGKISIISLEPYIEDIRPPERSIERLIANAVADFASGLNEHDPGEHDGKLRGASDCPLYYNPDQDIDLAAGPLALCQLCQVRLRKAKRLELVPIIESLLKAYP